jgi:hypothetical protein
MNAGAHGVSRTTAQVARALGIRTSTLLRLLRESTTAGLTSPCSWTRGAYRWQGGPETIARWLAQLVEYQVDPVPQPPSAGVDLRPDDLSHPLQAPMTLSIYAQSLAVGR